MTEKRKFERHQCFVKIEFEYWEGNPETIDVELSVPMHGKGAMLDISKGGAFVVTNERLGINMPVRLKVTEGKNRHLLKGSVVRTGLLKNNPSEVAMKYAAVKVKEDAYLAIQFDEVHEEISAERFASGK
ncbi:MAG: PilZ domain-containing protein [Spirochaetes bacterium]|nr:MAG: PilZ domain-containing protein [Spirochaetota bacterium]